MIRTEQEVEKKLKSLGTAEKARASARFFKTGRGQYGYGDVFVGVTVPEQRKVAKAYQDLPFQEVTKLLENKIHECRLTALLILGEQYKRGDMRTRTEIAKFYLAHTRYINNWDLVDVSAPHILGDYLLTRDRGILYTLAKSRNLWERRIAIIATLAFIVKGESKDSFTIVELLLDDTHDLIHKAMGWMLREAGKRCSRAELVAFIDKHSSHMPRMTLRYAIEHFSPAERKEFLSR
ncbi:MAG: DNA alkylation repair protein [Candidatus Pacebacteria bacterium]|nr:DNA alkylation repair protein [Candidatus Paceibacterota bacterium]